MTAKHSTLFPFNSNIKILKFQRSFDKHELKKDKRILHLNAKPFVPKIKIADEAFKYVDYQYRMMKKLCSGQIIQKFLDVFFYSFKIDYEIDLIGIAPRSNSFSKKKNKCKVVRKTVWEP